MSSNFLIAVENKEDVLSTHEFKVAQEDQASGSSTADALLTQRDIVTGQNEDGQNISDTEKDLDWESFDTVSGNPRNCKHKHASSQRINLRQHNIIAKDKAYARLPSDYKFDRSTTNILQMLVDQRHSGEFHNVVGKGANSVVIHAHCHGKYHIYFPCGNAVKVYKLSNSIEKNNVIYKQVQREYEHLLNLENQHISNNTPHPVHKNKNVIIMSFIGSDQETAPSISSLPSETLKLIYHEIAKEMDTWYNKLGLIHGNLSASNILYWTNKLYFLGWSHSVQKDHAMALKKLIRDCHFVTTFFQNRGVPAKSVEDLFKAITRLDKISCKVREVVHKDLWKSSHHANPNRAGITSFTLTHDRFK